MRYLLLFVFCTSVFLGCEKADPVAKNAAQPSTKEQQAIAEERAKLSPEDRALVEAQEWCVISETERLGSMGAPIKLMIKEQPVFICCKGCERKAEANPDQTLAKLEELKAKKKAEAK